MQRRECVRTAEKVERSIDVGAREGVLREVRVRREVEEVRRKRHGREPEIEVGRRKTHALTRVDRRVFGGEKSALALEVGEEECVARHLAAEERMRVVARIECPAIGLAEDRHEVRAVEIEILCECGAVDLFCPSRSSGRDDLYVARDNEAIES